MKRKKISLIIRCYIQLYVCVCIYIYIYNIYIYIDVYDIIYIHIQTYIRHRDSGTGWRVVPLAAAGLLTLLEFSAGTPAGPGKSLKQ